ncbi:hypothetical protein ACT7DF_18425 [Bacillus cereus]
MTIAISAFSLLTSVVAAETVYLAHFNFRVITIIVWMSICVSQFFFPQTLFSRRRKIRRLKI